MAQPRTLKQHTWSKGLQRSYLKLRCKQLESGKTEKLLSTVDHFDGFRVTHQLAENEVVLTVVRTIVQPRLTEIRALAKNECKDLSPIVTTTTLSFTLPAVDGNTESCPFGENMIFRATLQSLDINSSGKKWVIIVDEHNEPSLVLNADDFLRGIALRDTR